MWIDLHNAVARVSIAGKLLYATYPAVAPGKVLLMKETELNWQYVIFHDEDEAATVAEQAGVTLLHVRDAPMKIPNRITPPQEPPA